MPLGTFYPNYEEIDRLRQKRIITWTELCRAVKISQASRTKLRAGQPVTVRTLRKLATFFKVNVARLVTLNGQAISPDSEQAKPSKAAV